MLRCIEGGGGWGKGSGFEELTNECSDKVDMTTMNEKFSLCENGKPMTVR